MAKIWTYKGSQYKLYKTPKTFNKAAQAAANSGGYLAEIDNIDENKAIYKQLSDLISTSEFSSTTSQDGGGSAYVWIGCLLYTSPSPRDLSTSRMPSSA